MPDSPLPSTPRQTWQPPSAEELQALLPQYEITALLGRGGMGAVYDGWQKKLKRKVAVKILPPGLAVDAGDASYAERFRNEARVMARLCHPGIVTVYASGETATGLLYIVMEFVGGTDISRLIAQQGRLSPKDALDIAAQVCEALQYAHERGVIHRDIKPANIMLEVGGRVKVADFGLAKLCDTGDTGLTQSGMAMGTLHYMAPEALILGLKTDHRADIYAVGVMLYHMLTGRLPQGLFEPPSQQIPGLDTRAHNIITRALSDDREARYQSAAEMRRDLELLRTTSSVSLTVAASEGDMIPSLQAETPAVAAEEAEKHSPLLWGAVFIFCITIALLVWKRPEFTAAETRPMATAPAPAGAAEAKTMPPQPVPVVSPPATPPVMPAPRLAQQPPAAPNPAAISSKPKASPSVAPVDLRSADSFTNSLGMKFIRLPGTEVFMCAHETRVKDYTAYSTAKPYTYNGEPVVHAPDHPVVMITWQKARDFCLWLGRKEKRVYRLPTEREWNIAAGSGTAPTPYLWGMAWPPPTNTGNFADTTLNSKLANMPSIGGYTDGYATTAPVMTFPPNKFGFHDLEGNVREYCEDLFQAGDSDRVARGGSWRLSSTEALLAIHRHAQFPGVGAYDIGFRCVLDTSSTASVPAVAAAVPTTPKAAARYEVLTPRLKQIPFPESNDATAVSTYAKALLDYRHDGFDKYAENDRRHLLGEAAQVNFEAVLSAIEGSANRSSIPGHDAILQVVRKHANAQNQAAILRTFERHYALFPVIEESKWLPSAAPALAEAVRHYSYLTGSSPAESRFFRLCFLSDSKQVWDNLELLFRKPEFEAAANVFEGGLKELPADIQKSQNPRLQHLAATMLNAATKAPVSNSYRPYRLLNTGMAAARVGSREALEQLVTFLTEGKPPLRKDHLSAMQISTAEVLREVTGCSKSYTFLEVGKWVKYRLHSLRWDETSNQFVSR